MLINKDYESLTDEEAKKNFEKYRRSQINKS